MSNFLNNIILRHSNPANQVRPRLRGIFEPENIDPGNIPKNILRKEETFTEQAKDTHILPPNDIVPGASIPRIQNNFNPDTFPVNLKNSEEDYENEPEKKYESTNYRRSANPENPVMDDTGEVPEEIPPRLEESFSNFVSGKNAVTNETSGYFQDAAFQKENRLNNLSSAESRGITPPLASITAVAAQAGNNVHQPVPGITVNEVHVNQNNPSQQTLNRVRSIKNMINYNAGEKSPSPAPVIKVNIGRIDVRALTQQTPVRSKAEPKPVMTLDEFLKKKNGSQ